MGESLARQNNALSTTEKASSSDLVLAKMLDLAGQVMGREVHPGEIRLWSETFKDVNPKTLEVAFRNYLKLGKFFPKPGDIWEQIENIRGAMASANNAPFHRSEIEREQDTPEWQAASTRARQTLARIAGKGFPAESNGREKIKQQYEAIKAKRNTSSPPDTSDRG